MAAGIQANAKRRLETVGREARAAAAPAALSGTHLSRHIHAVIESFLRGWGMPQVSAANNSKCMNKANDKERPNPPVGGGANSLCAMAFMRLK